MLCKCLGIDDPKVFGFNLLIPGLTKLNRLCAKPAQPCNNDSYEGNDFSSGHLTSRSGGGNWSGVESYLAQMIFTLVLLISINRHFNCVTVDYTESRSTPLFDTSGTVHSVRLKQQGLRFPALSFDMATSILRCRVSACFVALIQRIQSQRAIGVISFHNVFAGGAASKAFFRSVGTIGSGHSLMGSISTVMVSPTATRTSFRKVSSTLNQ